MSRLPLRSTLFPYTTLFRSLSRSWPAGAAPSVVVSYEELCQRGEGFLLETLARLGLPAASGARGVMERESFSTSLRSEEHTSELQSLRHLVCRLLLEKKKSS